MNRVQNTKLVLWLITGLAAAVVLNRFVFGLGATTNLNDATPWGLWIGVDVMGGVALAAGGFVITAIFYIMKREEFHPLVKPAVLTAFLGYLAVIMGLLFDLGLPWNIWHMIIYWNPFRSRLVCNALYSSSSSRVQSCSSGKIQQVCKDQKLPDEISFCICFAWNNAFYFTPIISRFFIPDYAI